MTRPTEAPASGLGPEADGSVWHTLSAVALSIIVVSEIRKVIRRRESPSQG